MRHNKSEFNHPQQIPLVLPEAIKKEDVVHDAIILPIEVKESPKNHKEELEERKSQVIAYFDLPEDLIHKIRFEEDEFSEDNLEFGCYLGNQSLHDYLLVRDIENLAKDYGIPSEIFNEIKITQAGPMIGNETFEQYKSRREEEDKEYKKTIEKNKKRGQKYLQKYYPHWTANYYDN